MEIILNIVMNKRAKWLSVAFLLPFLLGAGTPSEVDPAKHMTIYWRVKMKKIYTFVCFFLLFSIFFLTPLTLHADEKARLSDGQIIYVPAYSHIYHGNKEKPFMLAVTLSIRNIDLKHQISITVVDYYETQGGLLKKYLDKPVILNPLASIRYIVPQRDKSGGSGANFIVEWNSVKFVNPPVIESIMIGTHAQQGISFTSRGQVIDTSD